MDLQIESGKLKEQNELFKQVIDKFFEIRQSSLGVIDDCDFENKCEYLLRDDPEMWSFDDDKETSTTSYIVMLEKELESLNNSVGTLRNQAAMGLDIEDHLKKEVHELEKEKILLYDAMKSGILELRHFHTQNRCEVMSFLEQEKNQFKAILDAIQERTQFQANISDNSERKQMVAKSDDLECRDVHITTDTDLVPQVPARAAAAAAVARAIASLPTHQRHSLPSGSGELVSIYGSRPRGELVEEIRGRILRGVACF